MYHILLILLAAVSFPFTCLADSSLAQVPNNCESSMQEENLQLDPSIVEKYQAAANFFSTSSIKTVITHIVTYETTPTGVSCHVGWYGDGNITTALNGTEMGKQVVFYRGGVTGVSYAMQVCGDHFVHYYPWGKVISYTHLQKIIFY